MSDLTLIRNGLHEDEPNGQRRRVCLRADRAVLAKRRWRGVAEDGREFGFDLDEPLPPGATFFVEDSVQYVLEQAEEEVLEIPVATAEEAARVAWNLGNLHFGVQVVDGAIRVMEDPAVRQFLSREDIACRRVTCVFLPLSAASHHHAHHHE
jgi:urease accessory protein